VSGTSENKGGMGTFYFCFCFVRSEMVIEGVVSDRREYPTNRKRKGVDEKALMSFLFREEVQG